MTTGDAEEIIAGIIGIADCTLIPIITQNSRRLLYVAIYRPCIEARCTGKENFSCIETDAVRSVHNAMP